MIVNFAIDVKNKKKIYRAVLKYIIHLHESYFFFDRFDQIWDVLLFLNHYFLGF